MKNKNPMMLLALLPLLTLAPTWSQAQGRGDGPRMGGQGGPGGMRNSPKRHLERWIEGARRLDGDPKTKFNKAQAKKFVATVSPWRSRKTMTDAQAKALEISLSNILTVPQKNALAKMSDRPPGSPGGPNGSGPGGFGGGRGGGFGGGDRPDGRPPRGQGPGDDGPPRDRPDGGRPEGRGPGGMGGERPTEAQMKAMRGFQTNSNPLAAPQMSPGFSSLPERMQKRMTGRYRDFETFFKQLTLRAR